MISTRGILVTLLLAAGLLGTASLLAGPRTRVTVTDPPEAAPALRGLHLRVTLADLHDLQGGAMEPSASELEVWVVVSEGECASCLFGLPETSRMVREAAGERVPVTLVAMGDRLEARRALLGLDLGMPALSAPRSRPPLEGQGLDTPMVLVTWHGRVVEVVPWSDPSERPLAHRTVEALRPWLP